MKNTPRLAAELARKERSIFFSFGTRLRGLGRIRLGFRVTWWSLLFIAMYYLMYYSLLGVAWSIYGTCFLIWKFTVWMVKLAVLLYKWLARLVVQLAQFIAARIRGAQISK